MQGNKAKIGFLYFDDIHIIPHFLGPLKELYESGQEVHLLTYEAKHEYLYGLLDQLNISREIVRFLPTFPYRKILNRLSGRKYPSHHYVFRKNRNILMSYDVLVFNDLIQPYIYRQKKNKNLSKPKLAMLMHGAGDHEYMIGEKYKDEMAQFDLITAPGPKIMQAYKKMKLPSTRIALAGYQKFDLLEWTSAPSFFNNNNKTVLYNPHFKRELSSWYRQGIEVLEFFYKHPEYNLIFAPHINLFNKKGFLNSKEIPQKYFKAPNILIDTNSYHLVNMDYTRSADIYLGDVSSQIYEFIFHPRPALFLNSHGIEWINNPFYKSWHLGPVFEEIEDLEKTLQTVDKWFPDYIKKQVNFLSQTFFQPKANKVSKTIAKEIINLLK